MTIYLKDLPQGVDYPIQQYQKKLWAKLRSLWSMDDDKYLCCGRCYRDQSPTGTIPRLFEGGKEYKPLFFDDNYSAISFFGCEEKTIKNGMHSANCHLIFLVDLAKVKPSLSHRADEETRMDVYMLLKGDGSLQLENEISGIDNVFREYNGWNKAESIKYKDMQPLHCFRFNFKLQYDASDNYCKFPDINK